LLRARNCAAEIDRYRVFLPLASRLLSAPARSAARDDDDQEKKNMESAAHNIQSSLQETRVFPPSASFVATAGVDAGGLARLHEHAARDHEGFWAQQARAQLAWQTPFVQTLDDSRAPHYRWFAGGRLNASYNCLDRHLPARAAQTAIVFEQDDGQMQRYSYAELHAEVCRLANALRAGHVEPRRPATPGERALIRARFLG